MTDSNNNNEKKYDFLLFGVTGFTGKLAVEYLLRKQYPIRWAACGRNENKTKAILQEIVDRVNQEEEEEQDNDNNKSSSQVRTVPPILVADLVCTTDEQETILSNIVQQTKIVLTMAGPFEKYGKTLVKLCATYGVHYADITGETDFVRLMIQQYDDLARSNGSSIVCHCGNDCIPQDLMVYEMYQYFKRQQQSADNNSIDKSAILYQVQTYPEFASNATLSDGTANTAVYQLGKKKEKKAKSQGGVDDDYDPLLRTMDGTKSTYSTKNISTKTTIYVPELGKEQEGKDQQDTTTKKIGHYVGPWIMGPVMVNCIRRSNALLQYHNEFQYGDSQVKNSDMIAWMNDVSLSIRMASAIVLPSMFTNYILPQPGEGPNRDVMESSYMTLHAIGKVGTQPNQDENDNEEKNKKMTTTNTIYGKFHFQKDIGYLYTAYILMEVGMVLLNKHEHGTTVGGIVTPAVAMGHELTERILSTLDTKLLIHME